MPAEFIALPSRPFCPFERYRHGFDPPDQLTYFSFLPFAFDGNPLLFLWSSNNFCLGPIFQQLKGIEPFLHPSRQTNTPYILTSLDVQSYVAG